MQPKYRKEQFSTCPEDPSGKTLDVICLGVDSFVHSFQPSFFSKTGSVFPGIPEVF